MGEEGGTRLVFASLVILGGVAGSLCMDLYSIGARFFRIICDRLNF